MKKQQLHNQNVNQPFLLGGDVPSRFLDLDFSVSTKKATELRLYSFCYYFREEPVRSHLKNVYACLTMSTISAGAGAYVHIYTNLLSAGLLTTLGGLGLLILLLTTPDSGKNQQLRMSYLLGFAFFTGRYSFRMLSIYLT